VSEARGETDGDEVVCPHCKRSFVATPVTGPQERQQGFKCPHCRLFVALDRAEPAS
jgi:transposase-like protein